MVVAEVGRSDDFRDPDSLEEPRLLLTVAEDGRMEGS